MQRKIRGAMAAAGVVFAALAVPAPALADTDYVGAKPPKVGASDAGAPSVIVRPVIRPQAARGGLALTGSDIVGLAVLGGISVGTGVVLVRRGRPVGD